MRRRPNHAATVLIALALSHFVREIISQTDFLHIFHSFNPDIIWTLFPSSCHFRFHTGIFSVGFALARGNQRDSSRTAWKTFATETIHFGSFLSLSLLITWHKAGSFLSLSLLIIWHKAGSFLSLSLYIIWHKAGSFLSLILLIIWHKAGRFLSLRYLRLTAGSLFSLRLILSGEFTWSLGNPGHMTSVLSFY